MRALQLDFNLSQYRPDYLAGLFPRLAAGGYTHVMFELADKVRLDCLPDVPWGEAYTKEEVAGLLAAARAAGLTPFPLVQTLGHLEYLLTHAPYHPLREGRCIASTLCPTHPETLPFLRRYLDETAELFGQPAWFHLGADEVWLLGACPRCQARLAGRPKWELYAEHLATVVRHVLERGMRPIAWADIALGHPELLDRFPRELVWMDWDYPTAEEHPAQFRDWTRHRLSTVAELGPEFRATFGPWVLPDGERFQAWGYSDFLRERGFETILAPAMRSGGDNAWVPAWHHPANVFTAARRCRREPAPAGLMVTSWACRLNHLELQWPGIAIPHRLDRQPTATAWQQLPHDEDPRLFAAWELLAPRVPFSSSDLVIRGGDQPGFGPLESLRQAYREANLDEEAELAKLGPIADGYARAQRLLHEVGGETLAARLWRVAAEALVTKAEECRLTLLARRGTPDAEAATDLLLRTEACRDAQRRLLAETHLPASAEREIALLYGPALDHQYRLAWNRPIR
jgi:hypothetical protein